MPGSFSSVEATTREYEIGDFDYWNAGPDLAIFYDDIYEQIIVEVIPLGHAETGAETMANESGKSNAPLYYVFIDTQGEIGWESGTFRKAGRPDAHVIEVLTEHTAPAYRAYLRKCGVSYILAGSEVLDSNLAAKKLYQLFGIDILLICGGGTINWTFLQQGAVDELSLLIAPIADGNPDSVTVFEKLDSMPECMPVEFQLKNIEKLKGNGVRLVYTVNNKG
ncbi:MAG: cyclophilin-like fold protein [Eubacteriales bacterium]|nr:cyclophilin-like fold protein [Eubacteriales bacterium]